MDETIILITAAIVILLIFYVVLKLCGKFRSKVYKLFIKAEKVAKSGHKMDYVIENVYSYLPAAAKIFINESALRWLLQKMFDKVEDFLNDGKFNGNEDE